jgi:CMP-N,N'-diacetyllegionaminic acid synthase
MIMGISSGGRLRPHTRDFSRTMAGLVTALAAQASPNSIAMASSNARDGANPALAAGANAPATRHCKPCVTPTAIALVPARAGSERVPGKNVRALAGHPLIAYSIVAARQCPRFSAVVVSTDSPEIARVAEHYGGEVPELRPAEMGSATSPDIEWVVHMLAVLERQGRSFDLFSILRPTSPFRTASTIERAFADLLALGDRADSIRAVEKCRQHPGKMWVVEGELMRPLLAQPDQLPPLHSRQYKSLPEVYVQNSSLEIAWTRAATEQGSISGERVAPFFTDEIEGFSIDYETDWPAAERLIATGAALPEVDRAPIEAAEVR